MSVFVFVFIFVFAIVAAVAMDRSLLFAALVSSVLPSKIDTSSSSTELLHSTLSSWRQREHNIESRARCPVLSGDTVEWKYTFICMYMCMYLCNNKFEYWNKSRTPYLTIIGEEQQLFRWVDLAADDYNHQ